MPRIDLNFFIILRETLEEEVVSRSNLLRQLAREQSEAQQWRNKFEGEALVSGNILIFYSIKYYFVKKVR